MTRERTARLEVLHALKLWIEERYDAEVARRPPENIHWATLDRTWMQMRDKVDVMIMSERPYAVSQAECKHPGNEQLLVPCKLCGASIDWSGG